MFIDEIHEKGKATSDQNKLVKDFFKGDFWFGMDKVYASCARTVSEATGDKDTFTTQNDVKFIYNIFTKYIHGFYDAIMEMYEGGTELFRTDGMLNTQRIGEMIDIALAFCVSGAFAAFALIAYSNGQTDLMTELVDKREEFQKSEAFKNIFV